MKLLQKTAMALCLCEFLVGSLACQKKEDVLSSLDALKENQLYITSGACNSGTGITTYSAQTSSRRLIKYSLQEGQLTTLLDFSEPYAAGSFNIDTGAQSVVDNGNSLLLLTENSVAMSDRKIYEVPKSSPYNTAIYSQDPLALTQTAGHIMRRMVKDKDGSVLISKAVAIEKIGVNTLRIPQQGTTPWVNAPAGACATSVTNISDLLVLKPFSNLVSSGKIIFSHQGATAALNRLAVIGSEGYASAANCLSGYQISSVTHTYATNVTGPTPITFATQGASPTAMVFIPTGTAPGVVGKLIVAYSAAVATETSNNVNLNYALVSWDVNETSLSAATLTNPVILSRQIDAVFGISAMTYDSTNKALYVAHASQTGVMNQTTAGYGYQVEKFIVDTDNNLAELIRPNNKPFIERSSETKCITSMSIGTAG